VVYSEEHSGGEGGKDVADARGAVHAQERAGPGHPEGRHRVKAAGEVRPEKRCSEMRREGKMARTENETEIESERNQR
jgi:hypothetical protein